jgi:hypothetical protein
MKKLLLASVLLTSLEAGPGLAQNRNPGVLPPNSAPHGLTYGEWSARWVKWAVEPPPAKNPLLDTTGANCSGRNVQSWRC